MEKSQYPAPITPNVIIVQTQSDIDAVTQSKVDPAVNNQTYSNDKNASAPPIEEIGGIDKTASAPPFEEKCFDSSAFCDSFTDKKLHDPPPPYPTLNEEQARDAILQFVAENCCYGKEPAQEMVFRSIESSSAFHYTLQTHAEKRETKWKSEPYSGRIIVYNNGREPSLWEIPVSRPPDYQEGNCKTEVPNTSTVERCDDCSGDGYKNCYDCNGTGQKSCLNCGGDGRINEETCYLCDGSGQDRCFSCSGSGRKTCSTCDGHGKIRSYKQLKCIWKNFDTDHVVERTALPHKLIRKVNGVMAFEEDLPTVMPVRNFPDHAVNEVSAEIVRKHLENNDSAVSRILRQRHSIRIIPVAQVHYEWKNKIYCFFVYGHENKVYAPKYPHRCCCCCAIL